MSFQLTIGGSDLTSQLEKRTLEIKDELDSKVNTADFTIIKNSGETEPTYKQEVVISDGSLKLFAGYIQSVTAREVGKGESMYYDVHCIDYSELLKGNLVLETYTSMTLGAIVADLISNYTSGGVTGANVETGPTITSIQFTDIPVIKCLEKLAKYANMEWYIDYDKDIHFYTKEAELADEELTDTSENFTEIEIVPDTSQIRNWVKLYGGRYLSSEQTWIHELEDDDEESWALPSNMLSSYSVYIDTGAGWTAQTVGTDGFDDPSTKQFIINVMQGLLKQGTANLSATNKIKVTYKYYIDIVMLGRDQDSIDALASITGGDGIYGVKIEDKTIKTLQEARDRIFAELRDYADPIVNGTFITNSALLQAGTFFRAGQLITINLSSRSINNQYLIQSVKIKSIDEDNSSYIYEIEFGGRLLGVADWLRKKIGEESDDTENIREQHIAISNLEDITMDDTNTVVSPTANDEEITADDTNSQRIVTAFKFGHRLHRCDAYDGAEGTWGVIAGTDADNMKTVTASKPAGRSGGTFAGFDIDVSKTANNYAGVAVTLDTPVDISAISAYLRFWLKLNGDVSNITELRVRLGSDNSNYYRFDLTTDRYGNALQQNWNEIQADVDNPDATVGSPDDANIDYFAIVIYYGAGQLDMSNLGIDFLRLVPQTGWAKFNSASYT